MKWCWVQRDRIWLTLLPGLLCWYWHIAWSTLEQWQELQVDVFISIATEAVASVASCCQRPIKNSVCQKNSPNHFVNKPMKYESIRLIRHISNLQWTNLYCPIQIYCSICTTICPGVLAISTCAKGAVAKTPVRGGQLVPKSQREKSHWVGLVLHWGWETVAQVWKHRCGLVYNEYTAWCDVEVTCQLIDKKSYCTIFWQKKRFSS